MTESIKRHHLRNLVMIAKADGRLDQLEKEFLLEKAYLLGYSREEVENILNDPENDSMNVNGNQKDREEQLADAILMAVIDGDVHEQELSLIKELAYNFHFSKAYVDQLLERGYKLWNNQKLK